LSAQINSLKGITLPSSAEWLLNSPGVYMFPPVFISSTLIILFSVVSYFDKRKWSEMGLYVTSIISFAIAILFPIGSWELDLPLYIGGICSLLGSTVVFTSKK